jgi:hypothetical protein
MQIAVKTREKRNNRGQTNSTSNNNTNKDDGTKSYKIKTGCIKIRCMTGKSKGFNVAQALKQFLATAREQDDECTILPLAGIGNNLCIRADVPNSKDGIEQYFQHDVKFNHINGKLRIHTSHDIGQLKRGRSNFVCISNISKISGSALTRPKRIHNFVSEMT